MLKGIPYFMTITCELPEDWVLRIRDLLWKGLTISDYKFTLQGKFDKNAGISVALGNRWIIKAGDGFDDIVSKVLRILWKSGISLEVELSRLFSSKELLPLLDKFEFTMAPELSGRLFRDFGHSCIITICKTDSDTSLRIGIPGLAYFATNRNLNKVLEFFRELYMWHPCDVSSTSSSGIENWEMPTFI